MNANRFRRLLLCGMLALGSGWSLAGCGETAPDEFQTYGELEREQADAGQPQAEPPPATEDAAPTDDPAADRAVSDGSVVEPATGETAPEADSSSVAEGDEPEERDVPSARMVDSGEDAPSEPQAATDESADPAPAEADDSLATGDEGSPIPVTIAETPAKGIEDRPEEETGEEETAPREVKVLVESRDFQVEGPEGALRATYDDIDLLRVLNMDPVTADAPSLMPDWLKDLDGQRIRIRGFMYPPFQETGLDRFVLARDNEICCFGRDPKVYDLIAVAMREGKTTDYIENRPFDVVGIFRIQPAADGEELYRLYRIEDALVIQR